MTGLRWFRDVLSASVKHPISLTGAVMATASAAVIVIILLLDGLGLHSNPYIGMVVLLILPGVLVLGLILIPLGVMRDRTRASAFPVLDLNLESHRGRFLGFVILSLINLVILATVTYRAVEYMDSAQFCGQTCHSVMHPEFTAYRRSPHSRVACVSCHVGSGAGWFVRSKLSGVRQVIATTFRTFDRPIPVPIENLRPARETCEQCHWPEKVHPDRIRVKTTYGDDERSAELKTAMILKVGGGSLESGSGSGIHWHMNIANEITYVAADASRQAIPFVRLKDPQGRLTDYLAAGAAKPSEEEILRTGHRMDCVDCHNRPSHIYRLPDEEVDAALQVGRIDRSLPFIKKIAVEALSQPHTSQAEAREAIPAHLEEYYRKNHPDLARDRAESIRRAGQVLVASYDLNVFPEMKITWGTYPSHIGHIHSPGCFRCHDGDHRSEDGRAISSECDVCHTLLAVEEENPEILMRLFPQ